MNGEVDLLVVVRGLVFSIDQQKAELSAVSAGCEVVEGSCMGVIPACARRLWRVGVSQRGAWRNHWRALFHRAVIERIDGQSMPMHEIRSGTCIGHIDSYRCAFAQPQ